MCKSIHDYFTWWWEIRCLKPGPKDRKHYFFFGALLWKLMQILIKFAILFNGPVWKKQACYKGLVWATFCLSLCRKISLVNLKLVIIESKEILNLRWNEKLMFSIASGFCDTDLVSYMLNHDNHNKCWKLTTINKSKFLWSESRL